MPTDKQLLVVASMDERIPVEEVLELELGDAPVFRNAGGKVTADVTRSVALSTVSFDTTEENVVNHPDCGMMSAPNVAVVEGMEGEAGGHLSDVALDPSLPSLSNEQASFADWVRMTDDIDEACQSRVEYPREHPRNPTRRPSTDRSTRLKATLCGIQVNVSQSGSTRGIRTDSVTRGPTKRIRNHENRSDLESMSTAHVLGFDAPSERFADR